MRSHRTRRIVFPKVGTIFSVSYVPKMNSMFSKSILSAAACALFVSSAVAQEGDKTGEEQKQLVPQSIIPPAPVLTPVQALKAFKIQPGYRVELVAAEPLVQDPIQIVFDPDGRLWVVELRGYMPAINGLDESAPVGSIAVPCARRRRSRIVRSSSANSAPFVGKYQ